MFELSCCCRNTCSRAPHNISCDICQHCSRNFVYSRVTFAFNVSKLARAGCSFCLLSISIKKIAGTQIRWSGRSVTYRNESVIKKHLEDRHCRTSSMCLRSILLKPIVALLVCGERCRMINLHCNTCARLGKEIWKFLGCLTPIQLTWLPTHTVWAQFFLCHAGNYTQCHFVGILQWCDSW